jgi:hypothetical protein
MLHLSGEAPALGPRVSDPLPLVLAQLRISFNGEILELVEWVTALSEFVTHVHDDLVRGVEPEHALESESTNPPHAVI